jgi:cytochrome c oxidase subunit II
MSFLQQASNASGGVDAVFLYIFVLSLAFLLAITSVIIYFVIKYHKSRHPKGEDIEGNAWLETTWTVMPTILFLTMFYYGWTNYSYMRNVPRDAMEITGTGRQWAWSFTYPNGKRTTELFLALGKPVKMNLRSLDVIHGFYIPAFRIKEDVVPGKENYTWFIPTKLGQYWVECTVICGVNHANMLTKAVVVPVSEFQDWYFGDAERPAPRQASGPVSTGAVMALLAKKECTTCHSVDGSTMVGPTFKGLYGSKQTVMVADKEQEVTVDDARLASAIRNPSAEIVKGYPPAMPPIPMTDQELKQVIDFIRTLK